MTLCFDTVFYFMQVYEVVEVRNYNKKSEVRKQIWYQWKTILIHDYRFAHKK